MNKVPSLIGKIFKAENSTKGITCKGPCLPKCCIGSKVLKRNPNGLHHGFDCVNNDAKILFDIKLKDGKMKTKIDKAEAEMKFYAGVFPACEGLEPNWLYDMHDQFEVDVTYEDKYVLMLNDSTKVI